MSATVVANDYRPTKRDYSLIGRDGQRAVKIGLSAAQWYHTEFRHLLEESYRHRSNKDSVASERALAHRISRAYDKVRLNLQVRAGC